MSIIDDIKDDITDMDTMHLIATSFTDTAAMRIRGIRKAFETNKEFYLELSHVYHLVKMAAIKQGVVPEKPSGARTVSVAFTANQHFYGNIHRRIMDTVLAKQKKDQSDIFVIGKSGREYLQVSGKTEGYGFIQFDKELPRPDEVEAFLEKIKDYTSILVYYPHFISLVRQEVGMIDIAEVLEVGTETAADDIYVLFEPEVGLILNFFERQIRQVLFSRVVLEADLARTAARMVSMNEAAERADELMKEKHSEYLKVMRSLINRQLLDTFAGRSQWKGT
jgi:ATP synthase F1 gamma subunit